MFILLLYALQDCGTATNVGRNVAYAMAIVLTSHYVLSYQFPYGSQPQFENKCQLINMLSLHNTKPIFVVFFISNGTFIYIYFYFVYLYYYNIKQGCLI